MEKEYFFMVASDCILRNVCGEPMQQYRYYRRVKQMRKTLRCDLSGFPWFAIILLLPMQLPWNEYYRKIWNKRRVSSGRRATTIGEGSNTTTAPCHVGRSCTQSRFGTHCSTQTSSHHLNYSIHQYLLHSKERTDASMVPHNILKDASPILLAMRDSQRGNDKSLHQLLLCQQLLLLKQQHHQRQSLVTSRSSSRKATKNADSSVHCFRQE